MNLEGFLRFQLFMNLHVQNDTCFNSYGRCILRTINFIFRILNLDYVNKLQIPVTKICRYLTFQC